MKVKIIFYLIIGTAALIIGGIFLSKNIQKAQPSAPKSEPKSIELKFAQLSNAKTNLCSGPDFIFSKSGEERLQGSCCSPIDFHKYTEQIDGLKKYSHINKIPPDPYDIPVSLAKELLDFQKTIQFNSKQQAIYDEAVEMSDEGGPCCCRCWRWYAFEGLARYLITEYNFDAQQIAQVWNLEDGCGGSGHIEGHT